MRDCFRQKRDFYEFVARRFFDSCCLAPLFKNKNSEILKENTPRRIQLFDYYQSRLSRGKIFSENQ